ncbi:helix-turn-helix domain-containing protein [Rudanella paleaurantiibacter]|uniref:Helix-turn-helix domain-containing protein n=1 Tax=Rudanella paleaurantiibacter TaxID=2614655 RepID=A0A7J5TT69_9BACT|nr:AraC family transcriptional regulator [Rudanella paleaurantiibacter]KAB7726852.1 helix-turn-helix domain-containing protein [Rudanella paleaurantiibacter]
MNTGQKFMRLFPSPGLREIVQCYGIIHFVFPRDVAIPVKAYTPKPAESIEFFLRDPEYVVYPGVSQKVKRPSAILSGQQTVTFDRYVGRDFLFFNIHFQPGTLFRLFGIPAYGLTNTFIDAETVLSKEIKELTEQLKNAESYPELIQQAELFISRLIRRSKKEAHGIDRAAQLLLHHTNPISMDWLASQSCLSPRQFERKFKERMGITASQLARIARFDKAFILKNAQPHLDWLSVAIQCGYYDYSHLVRDYKEFTGLTPAFFLEVDGQAPERLLGFADGCYHVPTGSI